MPGYATICPRCGSPSFKRGICEHCGKTGPPDNLPSSEGSS
ncbi:hypothetical protein JMJ77_0014878, partial [Colletotrichum scovillei]